jgi:hypothetical protein
MRSGWNLTEGRGEAAGVSVPEPNENESEKMYTQRAGTRRPFAVVEN